MNRAIKKNNGGPPSVSRTIPIVYTVAAILALFGLADALYLTVMHITGQSVICGGAAGCSKVLASQYSHIGPLPIAALGVIGYFAAFSCATFAAFRYARAQFFFSIAVGLMFLGTLWLLYVQAFLIHQFCQFCLFSAAIVFLLAGLVVATPLPKKL